MVSPNSYDFYTRSLTPMKHYWPLKMEYKCRSIKFAVDRGNSHKQKAQKIGREASNFIQNDLTMDFVYDYMFHLFSTEYSKLMRYQPTIPRKAIELCSEIMACPEEGRVKKFMLDSMVMIPEYVNPHTMPPAFGHFAVKHYLEKKCKSMKQVELWELKYWMMVQNQQR